jgi:putative glutamine amidotransferase
MRETKPLIGITADWKTVDEISGRVSLNDAYARSVHRAGGVAVLIPPGADAEALAAHLDGLLIPGGDDIDPKHYGEPPHPKAELVNVARFDQEWALLKAFEARRKPILGICYGCQLLNVWRGGALYQHLPDLPSVTLKPISAPPKRSRSRAILWRLCPTRSWRKLWGRRNLRWSACTIRRFAR